MTTAAGSGTGKVLTPAGEVSVRFDGPASAEALIVLAPGAGANLWSDFMSFVTDALTAEGNRVCRFNFAYLEAGKKAPDRQAVLETTYRSVVDQVTRKWSGKVVIGGKSMGGRIASHVAADGCDADGLVFLGYPLHPPGRPDRIRDQHLYDVKTPMLFVEGTRDPFCPLATLASVRAKLPGESELAVIEDGDHSFKVRKSSGRSTEESWEEVASTVSGWVAKL